MEGDGQSPGPGPAAATAQTEVGTEAGGQTLEGVRGWEPCRRGVEGQTLGARHSECGGSGTLGSPRLLSILW